MSLVTPALVHFPPAQRKINPSLLSSAPTRMQDSWLNSVTGISSYEAEPCHRDIEVILGYPRLQCATEKLDVYRVVLNSAGPIGSESHPLPKIILHLDATTRMLAYHTHAQVMAGYTASSAPGAGRAMGTSSHTTQRKPLETRHVHVILTCMA